MSETNKANAVAFHTKAIFEGDVDGAFRLYGGTPYRNTILRSGTAWKGFRKFVAVMKANRPDAHGEIKRVFADGDYVILHSRWHGLSDSPRGEAVVDIYRWKTAKWSSTGMSFRRSRKRLQTTTRCYVRRTGPAPFANSLLL